MEARISRFLVVTLGVSILGSFAIAPSSSYGQQTEEETLAIIQERKEETRRRIHAQKEYNDGYNRGFERAREEERARLDQEATSQQGGCCPSGGGQ